MIFTFWKEFRALLRFKAMLKKGRINEAALMYKQYKEFSDSVEQQVAGEIEEAKKIFNAHTMAVENLKTELQ